MPAILGRLTLVVGVLVGACLPLVLVPVVLLARADSQHRALLAAVRQAELLLPAAADLSAGALPTGPTPTGLAVSVYQPDGRVLGVPDPLPPGVLDAARRGEALVGIGDRVDVVLPAPSRVAAVPAVVRVSLPDETWQRDAARVWLPVVALVLAVALLGLVLAALLARRRRAWLRELTRTAERLADGDLTARMPPGGPADLRRVGVALNRLAVRVDHLMDAQRARAADLAHRLRTPLTALRLGVDALDDRAAATRLTADLAALNQAVDQVIRAMRWRGDAARGTGADLAAVVGERARFWSALAEDTGRNVELELPDDPVPVRVARAELRAAVDALLGNVFAHTPDGTAMWLRVSAGASGGGVLVVDDAGPGFESEAVVRRGGSSAGSTGLGLDIARRVAEESGGAIWLGRSPAGGARVELTLGPPE